MINPLWLDTGDASGLDHGGALVVGGARVA